MTLPMVSVYIPTHNRKKMLARAVFSVLNQDYSNLEIIISDDGSSDGTQEWVKALANEYSNVKYVRSETPKGANHARNSALKIATGEYVTGLDDDDFFMPSRISNFMAKITPDVAFLYSQRLVAGKLKVRKSEHHEGRLSLDKLLCKNYVGNQIFVERDKILSINGFDEELPAWQDYDCWIRLQQKHGDSFGLPEADYVMDVTHEYGRITSSDKVNRAVEMFTAKHGSSMSNYHRKVLASEVRLMKPEKLTLAEFTKYFNSHNFKRLLHRVLF